MRYTYRYSTTISTAFQGSSTGRTGLALDCVVDIEVVSKCHLMMQVSVNKNVIKVFLTVHKCAKSKVQMLFLSD